MRAALLLAASATAVVIVAPGGASAFDDAAEFDQAALEGGGGGRYFTGSVRDGFTCEVCHRGAAEPEVEITGLPEDGYVPGEIYDIELLLPDDASITAASVEVTDPDGASTGGLELSTTPAPDEMCPPVEGGVEERAAQHLDLPGDREVVAMDACGARRLRVSWRAPEQPRGSAWFHAAAVAADASSDPEGDGVRVFTRVIPVQGGGAAGAEVASTCSAGGRSATPVTGGLALAACLLVLRRRRGRRDAARGRGPR